MDQLLSTIERVFVPPTRVGPRPRTSSALPHMQLEQFPPREIVEELVDRSLALPYVQPKQSRMASPESRALALPDRFAGGPPDAFIDAHEFCHLHPLPEGSVHLTLPWEMRELAIDREWAEPHPAAGFGIVPKTLVMVYAPRNRTELAVVMNLIMSSYQFGRWGAAVLNGQYHTMIV